MGRKALDRKRIALLVNNRCIYDSRVIRASSAFAAEGNDVVVICCHGFGLPLLERRDNVLYCRIKFINKKKLYNGTVKDAGTSILRRYQNLYPEKNIFQGKDEKLLEVKSKIKNVSKQKILPFMHLVNRDLKKNDPAIFSSKLYQEIEKSWRKDKSRKNRILRQSITYPFKLFEKLVSLKKRSVTGRRILLNLNVRLLRSTMNTALYIRTKYINSKKKMRNFSFKSFISNLINASTFRKIFPRTNYARFAIEELSFFKPDIIHANELNTLEPAVIYKNKISKEEVRVIYDSHELETDRDSIKSEREKRNVLKYEGNLIKHSDAVITVSDGLADHIGNLYGIPKPTVVYSAPEAFADSRRFSSKRRLRKELGMKKSVPLGVYVGRLKLGRGHELILKGLAGTKGIHLAMVGVHPPKVLAAQQKLVSDLGIEDRVHFIPPVPTDEVVSYVSDVDFGVIPTQNIGLSYKYAMPNKLFEMSLSGLPIIGGKLPEIQRYIETNNVGIVMDETDPLDIARAMKEIIENRKNYKKTKSELKALIDKYSWNAQKQKLFDVHCL